MAGGQPIAPVDTAALAAAREASTGAWTQEVEKKGKLPRVLAPGMLQGAFSSWESGSEFCSVTQSDWVKAACKSARFSL